MLGSGGWQRHDDFDISGGVWVQQKRVEVNERVVVKSQKKADFQQCECETLQSMSGRPVKLVDWAISWRLVFQHGVERGGLSRCADESKISLFSQIQQWALEIFRGSGWNRHHLKETRSDVISRMFVWPMRDLCTLVKAVQTLQKFSTSMFSATD